jgi:phosphate transport system protein
MNNAVPAIPHAVERQSIYSLTMLSMQTAAAAVNHAISALGGVNAGLYAAVQDCEAKLDLLDRELDEHITEAVQEARGEQVRELLACMKMMTDLERIGDLLASFASRGQAVADRLDMRDTADLIKMASVLEQMLLKAQHAFANSDLNAAVEVLRADGEIDRLRNLLYVRLVEGFEGVTPAGVHLLFMAQSLERAGDHAKNLAEEICHVLSGHTLRHVLRSQDQPMEQMFIRWLKQQHGIGPRK